jgi:cell division protein FtsB
MDKVNALGERARAALYEWRRKCATVALCLLAAWVGFHVVFGANGMMVFSHKRAEHRALTQEIQDLNQENERLTHHIDALKTDPKTIEREAREQLRYARPGEVIYTLPQPRQKPSTITAQAH